MSLQGLKGDTGATGAECPQGDKGNTCATGAQGPQGPKGDTGATGAIGPQRLVGPAGPSTLTGILTTQTATTAVNATALTVTCPETHPNVVGGGYKGLAGSENRQYTIERYPSANAWTVA
jgi:collagen type II alpha